MISCVRHLVHCVDASTPCDHAATGGTTIYVAALIITYTRYLNMPTSLATLLLLISVLGAEGVAAIHAPLQVAIAGEVIVDATDVH